MTTRTRTDPRRNFVPRFLPWLLVAATLVVYWFTLNRWVSPLNLNSVARISGWIWQPEVDESGFVRWSRIRSAGCPPRKFRWP